MNIFSTDTVQFNDEIHVSIYEKYSKNATDFTARPMENLTLRRFKRIVSRVEEMIV
jgi:hypothetical protein